MGFTVLNHSNAVLDSSDSNILNKFWRFVGATVSVGSVALEEKLFIFSSTELTKSLAFCHGLFPENVTFNILG